MKRRKNKNSKDEDAAIQEGFQAAQSGKPETACPYDFQILLRAGWFIGWERGGGDLRTGQVKPKNSDL